MKKHNDIAINTFKENTIKNKLFTCNTNYYCLFKVKQVPITPNNTLTVCSEVAVEEFRACIIKS